MLKAASTILLIGLLFGTIYCLIMIVSPQTISGSAPKDIYDVVRHLGALGLAASIAGFFVLFNGFNKGQKWAWWGLFLTGIVAWGYGLVRCIINGDVPNIIGNSVGIALWLIGILLPLKVFFPKKA